MKWYRSFHLAVLGGLFALSAVHAQVLKQPGSVAPAGSDYSYYLDEVQPSPSDRPVTPPPVLTGCGVDAAGCGVASACDGACGGCGACDAYCEPWRLFPELPYCFTLTGWLAAGGTVNEWSTPSRYNGPVAFNDRREFQVNQLYMVLDRPVQMDGYGWDWGARLDLLYGTDFIFNQQFGWETYPNGNAKWNSSNHYGLAMPQAYVEVAYNQLSLKAGRFYTILGYESPMAASNFFYSHAYTMMYGEPFTHTGGLFTWKYSDQLDIYAGLVNGWDQFDGVTDKLNVLAGFAYHPCHGVYWINWSIITGETNTGDLVYAPTTLYSFVFGWNINCRWQYVLQHDLGWTAAATGGQQGTEWYGINQYLYYLVNDRWRLGARFEWFRDDDGARVGLGTRPTNPYTGGSPGHFYALTFGANWTPGTNLIVRPELRYDWYSGAGNLPFNDGASTKQLTAAVDFILRF